MGWMIAFLLIASAATAGAEDSHPLRPSTELLDVEPDAYGLGLNSDQYGRPHVYRTPDGAPLPGVYTDGVRRDAYGIGVHADEFGRAVVDGEP